MPNLNLLSVFPEQIGYFAFGNLERGLQHLEQEKLVPENADPKSRAFILELQEKYDEAMDLSRALNSEDPATHTRRFISKSNEEGGGFEDPSRLFTNKVQRLLLVEVAFKAHKEAKRVELVNDRYGKQTRELLQVIRSANRNQMIINLGDYLAALSNDFRNHPNLQMPVDRKKWIFMDIKCMSEIITTYDTEQEHLKAFGDMVESSLTTSLRLAFEYIKPDYENFEDLIFVLRSYSDRNEAVHKVNQYFEKGDHINLHKAILSDYHNFPFLGKDEESEELKMEVKRILDLVIKHFYATWSFEEDGFFTESVAMRNLRANYEKKLAEKQVFFSGEGFEDGSKVKKGEPAKDKSIAIDEKNAALAHKSEYTRALAECDGDVPGVAGNEFVASVLQRMEAELVQLRKDKEIAVTNSNEYHRKWMKLMEQNKELKDKNKKQKKEYEEKIKAPEEAK